MTVFQPFELNYEVHVFKNAQNLEISWELPVECHRSAFLFVVFLSSPTPFQAI